MNTAKPSDTFDHMMGSGALSYSWWTNTKDVTPNGVAERNGKIADDWAFEVTCEDGSETDKTKTVVVNHKTVMKAATKFMAQAPRYASRQAIMACRYLVFNVDECDFDANTADELLQYLVLGEIVFG